MRRARMAGLWMAAVLVTGVAYPASATHGNANSDVELWIMDADGSNERLLVDGWEKVMTTREPEWAPDGSLLGALHSDYDPSTSQEVSLLEVVDPDTGVQTVLTDPSEVVSSFAWAPNGSRLIYSFRDSGDRGLRTIESDGSNKQTVYTAPPNAGLGGVDFSPNGGSVSFLQANPAGGRAYLYVLDLATGTAARVTEEVTGISETDWSATGEWIAFEATGARLYVVRPEGTDGKAVASDVFLNEFEWSPDSSEILLTGSATDEWGIFLASAETGESTLLVPGGHDPTWSPDGERFAYSVIDAQAEDEDIYSSNIDGSDVVRLTSEDLHGDFNPRWSPDGSRMVFVRVGAVIACPEFYTAATIIGTTGDDEIEGTPGDDVIAARGGNDVVDGGGGNDIICGADGSDKIEGGAGRDILRGGRGTDVLRGADDDDILDGGLGDDELDGGDGRDGVSHEGFFNKGVVVDLRNGQATGIGTDTLVDVEDAYGSRGSDVLLGTGGRNGLFGGPAEGGDESDDILKGRGGGDLLEGFTESDRLFGGRGRDRLNGDRSDRGYMPGTDRLDGGRGNDFCERGEINVACERRRN